MQASLTRMLYQDRGVEDDFPAEQVMVWQASQGAMEDR
jgi:hypothetical protein